VRRVVALFASGPLLFVLMAVAGSCREPTQVTVVFRTNACADRPDLGIVTGSVASDTEARAREGSLVATQTGCGTGESMGTLVLARDSNDRGSILAVLALRGKSPDSCLRNPSQMDCITARRRFAYVKQTPLTMPILLSLDCAGVACDAFSTCSRGTCKDSEVRCEDNGTCPTEPGADGGAPTDDAGSADAHGGGDANAGDASDGGTVIPSSSCPARPACVGMLGPCKANEFCCLFRPTPSPTISCVQEPVDTNSGTCVTYGCCASDAPCKAPNEECCLDTIQKKTTCVAKNSCAFGNPRPCKIAADCRSGEACSGRGQPLSVTGNGDNTYCGPPM
jgi:hypothetical protein